MSFVKNIFSRIFDSPNFKEVRQTKVRDVLNGNILTKGFVQRQIGLLVMIVIFIFLLMENRMTCERQLARIDELNKALEYEMQVSLQTEAELNAASKRGELESALEKHQIPLKALDQRPYYIELK